MEPGIAFCGVACGDCPAYIATQAGDPAALEQVLVEWRAYFKAPHLVVADIVCDGCQTRGGRLNGYCQHCAIRPCALERSLSSCALCDEYACAQLERFLSLCDKLEGFFGYAGSARATLDSKRAQITS
jgi:hypothetical protein